MRCGIEFQPKISVRSRVLNSIDDKMSRNSVKLTTRATTNCLTLKFADEFWRCKRDSVREIEKEREREREKHPDRSISYGCKP